MNKKVKPKYRLDRWFMAFLALLLWTLGTILIQYGFAIPNMWGIPQFWGRLLAVIIAIFGWVWLFKIYVRSVRVNNVKGKPDEKDTN